MDFHQVRSGRDVQNLRMIVDGSCLSGLRTIQEY
jgi:hypothetical protein